MWRPIVCLIIGRHDHLTRQVHAQRGGGLGVGQVGAGQVGRAAQQLGQRRGEGFQRDLRGLARGHGLGLAVGGDGGIHGRLGEVLGQLALHATGQLLGQLRVGRLVGGEACVPGGLCRLALVLGVPVGVDGLRDHEGRGRPADGFAREPDFFGTQRLAVRLGGVGAVRAAFADARLAEDERGLVGAVFRVGDGLRHGGVVVAVHRADDVPAIGGKAQGGVVDEPGRDLAIDGDAVVVIQRDQLVQLPGAGQRAGLVADAFHQAAVAHEHVGVVVHHRVAVAVEFLRQQLFGQRHAHRVGDALAQRAGGGFHAGRDAGLGVAGGLAVQLAEVP
jgi:hypothetical protein